MIDMIPMCPRIALQEVKQQLVDKKLEVEQLRTLLDDQQLDPASEKVGYA